MNSIKNALCFAQRIFMGLQGPVHGKQPDEKTAYGSELQKNDAEQESYRKDFTGGAERDPVD